MLNYTSAKRTTFMMISLSEIKSTAQKYMTDTKNVLSRSKNAEELCAALRQSANLLLQATDKSAFINLLKITNFVDIKSAKEEICRCNYVYFLNFLCDLLSIEWYGNFGRSEEGNKLFNRFFLEGIPQDALLVLCGVIERTSPSFKQKKCSMLLEEFFRNHQLQTILCSTCDDSPSQRSTNFQSTTPGSSRSMALEGQRSQVMTVLVTLPDRMANALKKECSAFFLPDLFIPMVAKEILQTLHYVHQKLSKSENASLQFVSQLIGRLCIQGHTERLFGVLLPQLLRLTTSNFIWSRIAYRILVGAPERSLEGILEYLLKHCPWYGFVSRLLCDAVITNAKINFLLTNKFLLLRHFGEVIVPQNLIGYLASSPTRRHLIIKVLRNVLSTWGDRSAVKHTSHSQHAYLTIVIVICVGHLSEEEKQRHKGDITTHLMGGVQAHLESPLPRLRRLGMVAAEIIAMTLDPSGPKLKFEYEEDDESRLLWSLVKPPEDPGLDSLTKEMEEVTMTSDQQSSSEIQDPVNNRKSAAPHEEEEELDSDDEFEAYDMSHDTKVTKVKVPVYVRDCIDGLTAKDAPELTEASLQVAEKLIREKPDDLKDVCSQFAAILLHLDDQYNMDNFRILRHSAMVALAVNCPVEASSYLTGEFYNRNYNIRQRMDILEVLAAAAQELSKPVEEQSPTPPKKRTAELMNPQGHQPDRDQEENWRDIVQKRIESKTRRFAKGPSKVAPSAVANRFAPVAGHFFFPLLKAYDSKLNTMDLLGGDFLLLGRLMYTLGIVMYTAQNAPVCRQMAQSLLELIWTLRYHTEQYVRQSLMFAVSMVTLSVPAHLLVTDLQHDMLECRQWLQDILERDPEPECKALAGQTLMVLDTTISKELKGNL